MKLTSNEWKNIAWAYQHLFFKNVMYGFFIYIGVQGAKALLGV